MSNFFTLGVTLIISFSLNATDLHITLSPILNNKGNLNYQLCDNKECYKTESDYLLEGEEEATDARNRKLSFTVHNLATGFYSLTAYHDNNPTDGKLNRSWLGKPKEVFGISNITRKLWSKPKWEEVKFQIENDDKFLNILLKWQ